MVQTLPGLATTDLSASFMVRGGESDETLVRFDDIDLLEPHHIRDWGGAISIVNVDAVGTARLQRGSLPALFRLDLRLSRPFPFGRSRGEFYVELINATGWQNIHMYTFVFVPHPDGYGVIPERRVIELFPRVPTAGFEVSF